MSEWSVIGRWLVIIGIFIVAIGVLLWLGDKVPFLGRLPGDIHIKRKHVQLCFPLMTCVILSLVLSILINLFSKK